MGSHPSKLAKVLERRLAVDFCRYLRGSKGTEVHALTFKHYLSAPSAVLLFGYALVGVLAGTMASAVSGIVSGRTDPEILPTIVDSDSVFVVDDLLLDKGPADHSCSHFAAKMRPDPGPLPAGVRLKTVVAHMQAPLANCRQILVAFIQKHDHYLVKKHLFFKAGVPA